jgi:hypothetical protein
VLARYSDSHGRLREVLTKPGSGGSVLVIDRDATTHGDRRLVAHLAADEPRINAAVACSDYLSQNRNRRCRRLTPEDLLVAPFAQERVERFPDEGAASLLPAQMAPANQARVEPFAQERPRQPAGHDGDEVCDGQGNVYRLQPCVEGIAIPDLRWHRLPASGQTGGAQPVSLRDVVASIESYRPMRATAQALVEYREDLRLCTATLRAELERLERSPIVLNRGLREAVLAAVEEQEISLSEITIRCGRCKRDERGRVQGDTSWLARRIGLRPEAGRRAPTPWVHSDVLALIAREGLGLSPHEVELT